jgi:hypothetical protein
MSDFKDIVWDAIEQNDLAYQAEFKRTRGSDLSMNNLFATRRENTTT